MTDTQRRRKKGSAVDQRYVATVNGSGLTIFDEAQLDESWITSNAYLDLEEVR